MNHGWLAKAGPYTIERLPCPDYAGDVDETAPPKGVIHTTEGSWDGSMAVFRQHFAPHFLVGPGRIAQLLPLGRAAAALEHNGYPPTNGVARVQVEIVGNSRHTKWCPDAKTFAALAYLLATLEDAAGIPLRHSSPGRDVNAWLAAQGWCGHVDVPGNSHWDPGELDWDRVMVAAKSARPAKSGPSLTDAQERELFFEWRREGGRPFARPRALRGSIPKAWWIAYPAWLVRHPWPKQLPGWYWSWQAWKDGATKTRPDAAPRVIPMWAWARYALHKAGRNV